MSRDNKPYTQVNEQDYMIRIFTSDVDEQSLVWHRDEKSRIIEVIRNEGWKFQFDNELPFTMHNVFYIPKEKMNITEECIQITN